MRGGKEALPSRLGRYEFVNSPEAKLEMAQYVRKFNGDTAEAHYAEMLADIAINHCIDDDQQVLLLAEAGACSKKVLETSSNLVAALHALHLVSEIPLYLALIDSGKITLEDQEKTVNTVLEHGAKMNQMFDAAQAAKAGRKESIAKKRFYAGAAGELAEIGFITAMRLHILEEGLTDWNPISTTIT